MKKLNMLTLLAVVAVVAQANAMMDKTLEVTGKAAWVAVTGGALYGAVKAVTDTHNLVRGPEMATKAQLDEVNANLTALMVALHGPADKTEVKFDGNAFKKAVVEITQPTFNAHMEAEDKKATEAKIALEAADKKAHEAEEAKKAKELGAKAGKEAAAAAAGDAAEAPGTPKK